MTAQERIEAAIAARDKATPEPLEVVFKGTIGKYTVEKQEGGVHKQLAYCGYSDALLFAAAPDLVDEVVRLRKIIATLSRRANKLERDGVVRMTAKERGKWLDKQCEELEKRDENIAEGYGLERKWFAEAQEDYVDGHKQCSTDVLAV